MSDVGQTSSIGKNGEVDLDSGKKEHRMLSLHGEKNQADDVLRVKERFRCKQPEDDRRVPQCNVGSPPIHEDKSQGAEKATESCERQIPNETQTLLHMTPKHREGEHVEDQMGYVSV